MNTTNSSSRLKKFASVGVQFGHETWRGNPKMVQAYVWGEKNGVHLINLAKTDYQLDKAAKFLESVAAQGRPILWVGTKRAAQDIVKKIASQTNSPYVTHRWIGGSLTNYSQVKKSITKLLHYDDVLSKTDQYSYTKKEIGMIQKAADRLRRSVGGLTNFRWPLGAVVLVDVRKEHVAVKEANYAKIPMVALVDTNCDPSGIDYVIPGNDDAPRAIEVIMQELVEAVQRGQVTAAERPQEEIDQENDVERLLAQVERATDEEGGAKKRRSRGGGSGQRSNQRRAPGRGAPRPAAPREAAPAPVAPTSGKSE